MKNIKIILLLVVILSINSCKKPFEDGPVISLRSKMNRITGRWRLVSMEGVERLNPNTEQYMELTKDEISEGYYKVSFTNFQGEVCFIDSNNNHALTEMLFTTEGTWTFLGPSESYYTCEDNSVLYNERQGLSIGASSGNYHFGGNWEISRLTNKELIIKAMCYDQNDTDPCALVSNPMRHSPAMLTFEKN